MTMDVPVPVRMVIFIAGTNDPSNSATLAMSFAAGARTVQDVTVEPVYVRDLALQHFTLAHYGATEQEPAFHRLRTLVEGAALVAFFSPVWNFSVPAHCKNLIDRIGAFGLDQQTHSKGQLCGKPCVFVYTGGAPMIAWKALLFLTTLHVSEAMKYYGASVLWRHFEPRCMPKRGQFGLVVDQRPATLARMEREGRRCARIARHYATHGSLPAFKRVQNSLFTQLYRIGNRILYPISTRQ